MYILCNIGPSLYFLSLFFLGNVFFRGEGVWKRILSEKIIYLYFCWFYGERFSFFCTEKKMYEVFSSLQGHRGWKINWKDGKYFFSWIRIYERNACSDKDCYQILTWNEIIQQFETSLNKDLWLLTFEKGVSLTFFIAFSILPFLGVKNCSKLLISACRGCI